MQIAAAPDAGNPAEPAASLPRAVSVALTEFEIETYDLGGVGVLDITSAWLFVRDNPNVCRFLAMPLEARFARYLVAKCGVDRKRALRMPAEVLARPALAIPIDGTVEMIDGHHRAWARWRKGMGHIDTVVLPSEVLDLLLAAGSRRLQPDRGRSV